MLRKTSHQRASMKRNTQFDNIGSSSNEFYYNSSNHVKSSYESNVVYKSRKDSGDWNPNEMVKMSEKYGRESGWGGGKKVTTELAPGIVVEGKVADL